MEALELVSLRGEVDFLVVLLIISRFRWVSFICAFGAVYAAAFWVFVGLMSAAFIIGRGFYKKGAKSTLLDEHSMMKPAFRRRLGRAMAGSLPCSVLSCHSHEKI